MSLLSDLDKTMATPIINGMRLIVNDHLIGTKVAYCDAKHVLISPAIWSLLQDDDQIFVIWFMNQVQVERVPNLFEAFPNIGLIACPD